MDHRLVRGVGRPPLHPPGYGPDHKNFEEWFTAAFLPNISPYSVTVMTNASYHGCTKEPVSTVSWTKVKMMDWLSSKGIAYPRKCRKCDIWKLLKNIDHNAPSMSLMKLLLRLVSVSVQEKMTCIKCRIFYTGLEVA